MSNLVNYQNQLSSTLNSKLDSFNASMREVLIAMESQHEEHQNQTTLELTELHTSLESNTRKLTQLSTDVDTLDSKLDFVIASVTKTIKDQLVKHETQTTV